MRKKKGATFGDKFTHFVIKTQFTTVSLYQKNAYLRNVSIFAFSLLLGILIGSTFDIIRNAGAQTIISDVTETESIQQGEFITKNYLRKIETVTIQQENEYPQTSSNTNPARTNVLSIPSIDFSQTVPVARIVNNTLLVEDNSPSVWNGNFIFGHNPGVFSVLLSLKIGDTINYNDRDYTITEIEIADLDAENIQYIWTKNRTHRTTIKDLSEKNPLVLMTCYSPWSYRHNTSAQRLIIYAK